MDRPTALTWSWLNVLTKKRYDAISSVYGDLGEALSHLGEEMLSLLGCRGDSVLKIMNRLEEFDSENYERELKARGIVFLSIEDEIYPKQLKEIGDPPIFLYCRGDIGVLDHPCIALVGSREMSEYGKRVAQEFVPAFVRAGMVTVSGLALGIDAEVAEETLKASGTTVAVLGNGLAGVYPPSNKKLADRIVEGKGLILSEFPLDTQPDKFTFPARNRIIAGLSLGTVVLEAAEGSGALITADLALDYGREVFAVPGQIFDPNYAGCHELLSRGHGKLVSSPGEVLQELGIVASKTGRSAYIPQDKNETELFRALSSMPKDVDELVSSSKLPASQVGSLLTILELNGAAKNVGNGRWVRI